MRLLAALYFNQNVPEKVRLFLSDPNIAVMHMLRFYNSSGINWDALVDFCRNSDLKLLPSGYGFFPEHSNNWQRPDPEWIGAVLGINDQLIRCQNPEEDLERPLKGFCRGRVKEGRALLVSERPKGHVAGVGGIERAYSGQIMQMLNDVVPRGDVVLKGNNLVTWKRVSFKRKCTIIREESVARSVDCKGCGTPLFPGIGVWIGNTNEPVYWPCSEDTIKYDHDCHPVVVSLEMADRIQTGLGKKGYSLEPIFAAGGPTHLLVQKILSKVAQLPMAPPTSAITSADIT